MRAGHAAPGARWRVGPGGGDSGRSPPAGWSGQGRWTYHGAMDSLEGQRIVVMGLGRFGGGVGVARYCARQGADVLVTDLADASALGRSLDQLADLPIAYRLGGHNVSDFTTADLVVVNPAVDRRNNRFCRAAEAAGIPLTSEIRMLIERLPDRGRIIGVTGSAGKSTTCAMIHHVLARSAGAGAHLGGNIGGSLLSRLSKIQRDDWIVLELSSFMLDDLAAIAFSPHVAVITSFSANHLDRHGTIEAYARAKQRLLDHQSDSQQDVAILGPGCDRWFEPRVCRVEQVAAPDDEQSADIGLQVPGRHNQVNARLALAAANAAIGLQPDRGAGALSDFTGLVHRLQFVGERAGVRYFNDSKSTTPAAAMLAIDSFERQTVHVILGGYDKQSDLTELAHHAAEHCPAVYTIGATGPLIADAAESLIQLEGHHCQVHRCDTLDRAVDAAALAAKRGQVVVLSPGCASWDQFDHYEQRGERFVELLAARSDG